MSKRAVTNTEVEDEVTKADAKERRHPQAVQLAIHIDASVMETTRHCVVTIRATRDIANFRSSEH